MLCYFVETNMKNNKIFNNKLLTEMFDLITSMESCLVSFGLFIEDINPGSLFQYGFEDSFIEKVKSVKKEIIGIEKSFH